MHSDYFVLNNEDLAHQRATGTLPNNFAERSEIAQEIISRKSDFFERWSLLVFLVLVLVLVAGTWFVQFPDIIQARAMLKGSKREDGQFYVEVKLEQASIRKINAGMKVQLRFDAYPYQAAGFIPGTLTYVSNVIRDGVFVGFVQLDKGLVTSQNKIIPFQPGLTAQALIITTRKRLLKRLYYSIIKAASVNK
jgi:HlyD family secretion protein